MIDYQTMKRMRSLPRITKTLERRIEHDREELLRVRNDLLYEDAQRRRLARRERTLLARMERNTEKLNVLRLEDMKLRQKMAEVIA